MDIGDDVFLAVRNWGADGQEVIGLHVEQANAATACEQHNNLRGVGPTTPPIEWVVPDDGVPTYMEGTRTVAEGQENEFYFVYARTLTQ